MQAVDIRAYCRGTAAQQLARTEALWRAVAAGETALTISWYSYTTPSLVLGVGQDESVVDALAARAYGVAVARRATGGTAVLVDRTALALDLALPAAHHLAGVDVVATYRWLGDLFASTLRTLAPAVADRVTLVAIAEARADQRASRLAAPPSAEALRNRSCFGTLSPHEVALRGGAGRLRKLVGLSQLRKRGVVLFQAGLYSTFSGARLAGVLDVPTAARVALAHDLERRAASLADLGLGDADVPRLMGEFNRRALELLRAPE